MTRLSTIRQRAVASAGGMFMSLAAVGLLLGGLGCSAVRRKSEIGKPYPAGVAEIMWHTRVHEHGLFEPRPEECATGVVVDRTLVIGSRAGKVLGIDVADGSVLWTTPVSGGVDAQARYDQNRGQVYVGTDDGTLYALDPRDGKVRWSYKAKGGIERPAEVGGDAVYFATATDRVVAVEASTGKYRWQYEREAPEGFTIRGHAGPRLHGGVLYAGFADGFLVALNAASGEVTWARSLAAASDQYVDVDSTPVVFGDLVVASSYSGGVYGLRAEDGEVAWRLGIEGASTVRVVDKRLYVAAPRDGLTALSEKGHVLWRQGLADAGDLSAPIGVGPYLVFTGSRAGLFVVERRTGDLLELVNPARGMCAAPAVSPGGHELYVLANGGSLYAFHLAY